VLTFAITPALYVDDGPQALDAAIQAKADREARKRPRRRRPDDSEPAFEGF
jgi:hypothetical protein